MRLHQGDAADYVLKLAVEVQKGHTAPLDIAFIDVFDGNDDVPSTFCNPGDTQLKCLTGKAVSSCSMQIRHTTCIIPVTSGR